MMEIICIAILCLTLIIYFTIILLWKFNYKYYKNDPINLPKVSILIACRNEASNISKLIDNLLNLDYPKSQLEILIGDDDSDDNTLETLKNQPEPHIHIIHVSTRLNNLTGKMNVLAQLAKKSTGKFLLSTDADMLHQQNWIKSMLSTCDERTGLVAGFTIPEGNNFWAGFQETDYIISQGMMKVLIDLNQPIFASGNNMLIRKEAYDSTGGFEQMGFHITEDVLLFNSISKKGWKINTAFDSQSISKTKAETNLIEIIEQRKRWMSAFSLMPKWSLLFPLLRLFFIPWLLALAIINPILSLLLFSIKILLNLLFALTINQKLKILPNIFSIVFYDIYELIIYFPALVLRVFSKTIVWKKRLY